MILVNKTRLPWYHTDLIVCNRVLPDTIGDSFFDTWKESQGRHLDLIHECFDPTPVLRAPLMDRETVGLDALQQMGRAIFDGEDPAQVGKDVAGLASSFPDIHYCF